MSKWRDVAVAMRESDGVRSLMGKCDDANPRFFKFCGCERFRLSASEVRDEKLTKMAPLARAAMVAVTHLVSPATLPTAVAQLSVLSYNVLLPNSVDAWWTYKMYNPPLTTPERHSIASWDSRRDLLKKRIETINADVVCLQEVAPASFVDDFSFMKELGYDGCELFKKGRFRPATFWKSSRCTLAANPVHKDRTLLTAFRLVDETNNKHHWHVLNCHLQAAKQGGRRLRQINEGVRAAMTLARKLKEPTPESSIRLIACGDFNGGPECGAVRYLEDGFLDSDFLEDGEPVTSKKKTLPLSSPMTDAACAVSTRDAPPTMVVQELISHMVKEGTLDEPELSNELTERLTRIFEQAATTETSSSQKYMNLQDVEKWLVAINEKVGRGSEYRAAAKQMGWTPPRPNMTHDELRAVIELPPDGLLSLDGFLQVYLEELRGGKFWGIAHDLAVLGEPLPDDALFTARYDRMYCSAALRPTVVLDTTCDVACPNDTEPSDHLPVAAAFKLV